MLNTAKQQFVKAQIVAALGFSAKIPNSPKTEPGFRVVI